MGGPEVVESSRPSPSHKINGLCSHTKYNIIKWKIKIKILALVWTPEVKVGAPGCVHTGHIRQELFNKGRRRTMSEEDILRIR